MNRFCYSAFVAFLCVFSLNAQQITFTETTHDFGTFSESLGEVTHQFTFTNTGASPLIITRVTASCGCTTPTWTKEPIPVGGKGTINVVYNASGRPGAFDKSITVNSNSRKGAETLRIRGSVSAKKIENTEAYPISMGDLKLKSDRLEMKEVGKEEEKTLWIEMTNTGSNPITIYFENVPSHLYVQSNPKTLASNQLGMIFVTFNAKKIDDWGNRIDEFQMRLNNELSTKDNRTIAIQANIVERFDKSSNKMAIAPKIVFSSPVISMGKIAAGQKKSELVKVQNNGKSDLIIRKLNPSDRALLCSIDKSVIKPDQTATMRVTVDKRQLSKSILKESVQIISSDPQTPVSTINVVGE